MKYGYARVSTDGQSLDARVKQLRAAGAEKVFRETASGARADRAQLRRVLGQLDKGDVLMVARLDRLARSTRDLLNVAEAITGKGAGFRSLHDAWADSTTAHGRTFKCRDRRRPGRPDRKKRAARDRHCAHHRRSQSVWHRLLARDRRRIE